MLLRLFYFIKTSVFLPLKKEEFAKNLGPLLEPTPVTFSMDTIGWKVSFILLVIGCIFFTVIGILKYRKNKYRRMAMKELIDYISIIDNDNEKLINLVNLILKRLAIEIYGRENVANLYGISWVQYLDSKSKVTRFEENYSVIKNATHNLEDVNNTDCNKIIFLTKKWILTHAR
jgi:hypothetical protein